MTVSAGNMIVFRADITVSASCTTVFRADTTVSASYTTVFRTDMTVKNGRIVELSQGQTTFSSRQKERLFPIALQA